MDIGLILGLIKVSLDIFHDERKDRFLKQYVKLQREWNEEMSRSDDERSDLALDTILFECNLLAKLVITEAYK
jgi:hypothetical protein